MSEGLRGGSRADAAEVFGEGAVTHPEQAVLDLPVSPGEIEEAAASSVVLGIDVMA